VDECKPLPPAPATALLPSKRAPVRSTELMASMRIAPASRRARVWGRHHTSVTPRGEITEHSQEHVVRFTAFTQAFSQHRYDVLSRVRQGLLGVRV